MQATFRNKRVVLGWGWLMLLTAVVAVLILAGSLVVARESPSDASPQVVIGPDTTGLSLDRDGADLIAPQLRQAPDITGLSLDREGADRVAPIERVASDISDLHLDRDGADVFAD